MTAGEEVVAIFMMLVGLVVFGFIISGSQELLQYLAPRSRELGLLRKKMEEVSSFIVVVLFSLFIWVAARYLVD